MKDLVILGAGTAGTMMLNKLYKLLDKNEWKITIVDNEKNHYYQPGFLFIPFGVYTKKDVVKPKKQFFPGEHEMIESEIFKVLPEFNKVHLNNGIILDYDILIIATGSRTAPEETEGLKDKLWYKDIFDFYTLEGALALAEKFKKWNGGKLVVNITEMPIKCPVAPLEFAFLADAFFEDKRIREKVQITYVTPLAEAFTKHKCSEVLGHFLDDKGIELEAEFNTARIDNENKKLISWDEREIDFDLLVTVPVNKGADYIEASGLGDELNFVPTDKYTLQSLQHKNIFVIGDASNIPASKAGSVAHFASEILTENILSYISAMPLAAKFDGHANCFIESGHGRAFLIDFNYDVEPLPGKFPLAHLGPFSLLKESRTNHIGKLMFKWTYWNLLLKGKELPVGSAMSLDGKILDNQQIKEQFITDTQQIQKLSGGI
ncbi:MAG TPA: FAD/NAD(P)-binding oxidoreductase [Ignavibacteria bacterium]|nr:oxidoreductase [Bacteroidota bacterium]HRE11298.1 FAD/NAD(P)-binding oxidoreductase [Ignavibacteria bacterium]HRF65682.1 FAD/NAD(P)-binding oxidoreductase [Ignavibacteria bacterium]HRJ03286.1 FAD/NAD(P)-binding oxidoreductase [Ignavibacteria bacterium]